MHLDAIKFPFERGRRPAWRPVMSIAHEENIVIVDILRRSAGGGPVQRHFPGTILHSVYMGDGCVEGHFLTQSEVIQIGVEVIQHLRMVRKVRIVIRDREVLELHTVFGCIDVQ